MKAAGWEKGIIRVKQSEKHVNSIFGPMGHTDMRLKKIKTATQPLPSEGRPVKLGAEHLCL